MLTELEDLSNITEYLAAVDLNRSNRYSAMEQCLDAPDFILLGHRIGMSLHSYWSHRVLRSEGREWHRSFLNAGRNSLPRGALAASMLKISHYCEALGQGDSEEALTSRRNALEIYRE